MPIERESDAWQGGSLLDRLGTEIGDRFLANNQDVGYSVEEVVEWVRDSRPEIIPRSLREGDGNEGVTALVAAALDRLDRRNFVTCRFVTDGDGGGQVYYAYNDGERYYPNVRLENDVVPRIDELEAKIEELSTAMDERISQIEYEVR